MSLVSRARAARPALRVARRDAWRHKGRSLLVVLMIGLPVMGVVGADLIFRTQELSGEQVADQRLGTEADALVVDSGNRRIQQGADPESSGWGSADGSSRDERLDVASVLPSSWTLEPELIIPDVTISAGPRTVTAEAAEVDLSSPVLSGVYRLVDGQLADDPDEVVLTRSLVDRMRLAVGDEVVLGADGADRTVVGVVERPSDYSLQRVIGPADSVTTSVDVTDRDIEPYSGLRQQWYVDAGGAITWEQVKDLNNSGLVVTSRAVLVDPPPCTEDTFCFETSSNDLEASAVAVVVLVVVMALLQVVLLAGPAFAIGRRSQSRDLALVAAAGGNRRHVGAVVRAGGVVLGAAGAAVGAVAAVLVVQALLPTIERRAVQRDLPALDLRPLEILAVCAIGIGTGLVAAWLPARQAAKQDVVAALAGRRPAPRVPRRVPILGAVALVIGVAVTIWGTTPGGDPLAIVAGSVLGELGIVAMSPTIIAFVARLGPHLPAVPRLALRDAARSRTRSGPAVAAVMAAVAGAVAVGLVVASQDEADRRNYQPQLGHGDAIVAGMPTFEDGVVTSAPLSRTVERIDDILPVARATVARGTAENAEACQTTGCTWAVPITPKQNMCPLWEMTIEPDEATRAKYVDDWRCDTGVGWSGFLGQWAVGDAATLATLTGTEVDAASRAALEAGGVVLFDRVNVVDGRASFDVTTGTWDDSTPAKREVSLAAAHMTPEIRPALGFLSPEAAQRLGLVVVDLAVYLHTDRMPTQDEQDRAAKVVASSRPDGGESGLGPFLSVERGYTSDISLPLLALAGITAVVALGATTIAVGLASADGKPDLATLAAVGAAPRTRRRLASSQAFLIAGLGTALGIVAGFVPGYGAVRLQYNYVPGWDGLGAPPPMPLEVPWWNLAVVAVVVPLLAAVCGALFTRSRLPMVRRLT